MLLYLGLFLRHNVPSFVTILVEMLVVVILVNSIDWMHLNHVLGDGVARDGLADLVAWYNHARSVHRVVPVV